MVNQPVIRPVEGGLPQNIEAEQAVLGSLLIDPRAIERIASFLRPDDFYLPVNAEIYRSMLGLYERDMPTDVVTLSDHLQARDRLDDTGGVAYLASLATIVPTSINVDYYARIVERLAVLRRLVEAGNRIASIGHDERLEADEALEEAEKVLFEISRLRVTRDFESLSTVLAELYERLDHIHSHDSEVTGVTTGYIDLDRLTSGLQRSDLVILAARPSMGKCLTAGSLIDHPETGERLTIEEYVRRRVPTVLGLSDSGAVRPAQIDAWIDSGIKPCYRVMTRTGRSVEVTGHHPFLTVRGWVPLHDLTVGTKIAVPRALPCFGHDTSMDLDLVRLLAYFIAEGSLTDRCPEFTNTDPAIIADFMRIVGSHFPECRVRQERISYIVARPDWRTGANNTMRGGSNPLTAWLRTLGLMGKKAEDKAFPAVAWRWDRPRMAELLRAFMSCDGSIYAVQGSVRIDLGVASEQLARDVHHALVRFGIISKLYRKRERCWVVSVTESESVERYQCEIGWIGEKSSRFTDHVFGRKVNVGHPSPDIWASVKGAASGQGLTLIELARRSGEIPDSCRGKFAGYNPHTSRGLLRERLAGYAAVLADADLTRAASADIYWDEIVSVEPVGEHQVYDLTVPDGENFIAQDICVHNTALALNVAHAVATRGRQPVGIFSIEMSAEQLAQRLISLQAQIDSQKLRTGRMSDSEWDRLVEAIGVLSEAPIFVDDTPGLSTVEMRSKARRLHTEQGLGLLIVDYLQLIQGASSENRVQEISAISRGLKAIARELDVPVLALSQLSRAPEQRPNHEPMLSDLRESGCLAGDTLVYLPDKGTYERIEDLVGRSQFNVLALNIDTWKLERRPVLRAFSTGRKPVLRLKTRLGRTIRATGNHRFLTIEGWERLDRLAVGGRIALPGSVEGPNEAGMTHRQLHAAIHTKYCGTTMYKSALGRERALRVSQAVQSDVLRRLAESDVYWDEIVSIEPDGEEEVYDLTVDGLHNFVANDITVHNSIEQDADLVMFLYRDVVYNRETERPHVADVIVAKHRNGPTGRIHLFFQDALMKFLDLSVRDDG